MSMSWNKFYELVKDHFSYTSTWGRKHDKTQWLGTPEYYELEWSTGGMEGGNCWDNTVSTRYQSNVQEPESSKMDTFLEIICPDISFLNYKKLMADIVTNDTRTEYDYYGNCTYYAIKKFDYRKLYDNLVEMGAI